LNTKVQPDDASKPVTVEEFLKETALRKIGEQARRVAGDLAHTERVAFGPTAVTVVDQARLEGVDLLVVGTHGRTGLRHLLLGSVAERIVRTATVPVLVVRHEEEAREDIHTQAENTLKDEQQG